MRWSRVMTMFEAHAEGEVGRVVTGGAIDVPGATMIDKMNYLNGPGDDLRRFCVMEPRGSAQMSTNLIFAPSRPDANAGFIVLQGDRAHSMSGSNCICVATVLLETGMVAMTEPETIVRLDTPAGLVTARAACRNGKCERVTLAMNPSFVEVLDFPVDTPEIGRISVDIAFGGVYYALIDPKSVGLTIAPDKARALVAAGSAIHRALKRQAKVRHPTIPSIDDIAYVMFVDWTGDGKPIGATVLPPGRLDRSPCGTGNSARLAVRYARGEARPGDVDTAYSIIRSEFQVAFKDVTTVGDRDAVLPEVSGRGWIHGMRTIGVDPTDPYPRGFMLADCWGDAFDLVN